MTKGRKPLFFNGLDFRQRMVAMLLGLGQSESFVKHEVGISLTSIEKWKKHDIFLKEIEKYREKYLQKTEQRLTKETVDLESVLVDIINRGKEANIKGSDVVSAAEKLARIKGSFAPSRMKKTIEFKELENKTDKELAGELEEINQFLHKHGKREGDTIDNGGAKVNVRNRKGKVQE